MAKQTFTVGQVLTSANMTSLQQTAMGGGSTTAKTASYTLVAADAGTVVQMNSASATTITVNTALFAAGDTVQIQNVGSGVCTVTAGTATVSTSSTLALKQFDAGSLYFNTTSAAIFFASDAADGSSPLTTKGDLYGFSTLDARIPIGTNNQVLTADSAQALGLKWATPSSAGSTLLGYVTGYSGSNFSTTSTSFVDIDATVFVVTFTAPASGAVVLRATMSVEYTSSGKGAYNWRESTTNISNSDFNAVNNGSADPASRMVSWSCRLDGITAGSHTYKLGMKTTNGATTMYGFVNDNRYLLEVWSA